MTRRTAPSRRAPPAAVRDRRSPAAVARSRCYRRVIRRVASTAVPRAVPRCRRSPAGAAWAMAPLTAPSVCPRSSGAGPSRGAAQRVQERRRELVLRRVCRRCRSRTPPRCPSRPAGRGTASARACSAGWAIATREMRGKAAHLFRAAHIELLVEVDPIVSRRRAACGAAARVDGGRAWLPHVCPISLFTPALRSARHVDPACPVIHGKRAARARRARRICSSSREALRCAAHARCGGWPTRSATGRCL